MITIKKFAIHKTALTFACVMALSSLIFIIPIFLVFMVAPMTDPNGNPVNVGPPVGLMLFMPVAYLIMGYVMTALGSLIYNLVAKATGGIQFELEGTSEVHIKEL